MKAIFLQLGLFFYLTFYIVSCSQKLGDASVLNYMTSGKEHFKSGRLSEAKSDFLAAAGKINEVWGDSEEAKKARSLWYDERVKPFKGEPYERTMVFFYLGLIFMIEEDYGNAQASFKQAQLQDAFAEESQNQADTKLAVYLQAVALAMLNSKQNARQAFVEYEKMSKLSAPDIDNLPNTILIIESGSSPQKYADGNEKQILKYRRGTNLTDHIVLELDTGEIIQIKEPIEDIYWQASTRGGRPIDGIIEGKVAFKKTTKAISDISREVAIYSGDRKTAETAAIISIFAGIFSAMTRTTVDTRHWKTLPEKIYLVHLDLESKRQIVKATFRNIKNDPVYSRVLQIQSPTNKPLQLMWINEGLTVPANYTVIKN